MNRHPTEVIRSRFDSAQLGVQTANGLHAATHAVFRGGTLQHLDSIAFTFPLSIRSDGPRITSTSHWTGACGRVCTCDACAFFSPLWT
jgi:hypothetical protein